MPPILSVIVPTFKRDWSLERLMWALKAQTLERIQIIVVDQNPVGFLASSVTNGALADTTIVRIDMANCSTARNVGFVASNGSYVLFIDDDLIPERDFCARMIEQMRTRQEIACLVPVVRNSNQTADEARKGYIHVRVKRYRGSCNLWQVRHGISAVMLFTRSGYERSGGFDEGLFAFARTAEDHELFTRMSRRGIPIWHDSTLIIDHDEETPGGAEMRTVSRDENRARCIRAWAYTAWTLSGTPRRLRLRAIAYLLRICLLNRPTLASGPRDIIREARFILKAIRDSRAAFAEQAANYVRGDEVSHLARHRFV